MRPRSLAGVLRAVLAAATLLATTAQPAAAQVPDPGVDAPIAQQGPSADPGMLTNLGLKASAAFPRGDFAENIGAGFGLTGDIAIRLLPAGWLGLRLDGGMIWYGYETRNERVNVRGFPLEVDLTTTNTILMGGFGPQLHARGYPINADVYALIGVSRFATTTSASLDSSDPDEPDVSLDSTVHLSDWTTSVAGGGEVNWTIDGDRQGFLLGITLGLEYRRHGITRYLNKDSIDDVEGRATFTPFETRADFWLLRIGLRGGTW